MDSGTHLVMGLGLGGLAMIDPAVSSSPAVFTAVMAGTIIGSQAPDLDGLLRIKSNAAYIKNHRGVTHSIPAIAIWTVLITVILQLLYKGTLPWLHVLGWVLLAVVLHVVTDLFNAYGTQAMRPFSDKWISWNIIHIFDPVIFASHIIALLLWAIFGAAPQIIFPLLYAGLVVYFIWRTSAQRRLMDELPKLDPEHQRGESYILIPTISLQRWNLIKVLQDNSFAIGNVNKGILKWVDHARCSAHPAVHQSKSDPSVQAFLYLTAFACAEVKEHPWGFEVRWADVRYRHRQQYPFMATLLMDKDYKTLASYVGWLSDERLEKRLRMNTY
ncbi:metal-dependent hydrolase [Paenibacillus pinihumi]|uniref:metal-dependent hydrolase n=1 Tax=Paenibacillus pinihumi TaxID=669462 RepID=UPI0003F7975B|nr:metal-dependent hydrolase [Paenibacillus pinihumi]